MLGTIYDNITTSGWESVINRGTITAGNTAGITINNSINPISYTVKKEDIEKDMSEIKSAYLHEMERAYKEYKTAVHKEIDLLKFNKEDGELYQEALDKGELTSQYWLGEYMRLRNEFQELKLLKKVDFDAVSKNAMPKDSE